MLHLYIMADFETSKRPDKLNSVYAWLTGYKVCGLMELDDKKNFVQWLDNNELNEIGITQELKYFYGKSALKEWLNSIMNIAEICKLNGIKCHVFFHNARYDFSYIQFHILKNCGKYNNKSKEYYLSNPVIDENNTFYMCDINLKQRIQVNKKRKMITKSITVHDLYKILPSSLANIGDSVGLPKGKDFDYDMIRPFEYVPTIEELEGYFYSDINIMCKAYKRLPSFFYGKYTIGSIVKSYYLNSHLPELFPNKNKDFLTKDIFPSKGDCIEYTFRNDKILPFNKVNIKTVYDKVIQGYKGGMTICNNAYLGKTIYNSKLPKELIPINTEMSKKIRSNIYHLDVNSLYPSQMKLNDFPIGKPKVIYSDYETNNTKQLEEYLIQEMKENNKKIIIQVLIKFGKIKKDKAPLFLKNDLTKKKDSLHKSNKISKENGYKAFYETFSYNTENITLEEFLLLKENYTMKYEIKYAIVFNSISNLFTSFVDELAAMKIKYDKDEFLRLCYKLCLNNLYGKFGEKAEKTSLLKDVDEDGNWISDDKRTKTGDYFYPPIAVYVTSYARMTMIKYINIVGWKNVIYMDTDSIHLIGKSLYNKLEKADCIHDTELGKLKLEDLCFGEKALSPKKYCYYGKILKKNKDMFKVKCAGLPGEAQKQIKSFDQYDYGLIFIPKDLYQIMLQLIILQKKKGIAFDGQSNVIPVGKLAQRNIYGGIFLQPCIFQIHIPDYIKLIYGIEELNDTHNTCII